MAQHKASTDPDFMFLGSGRHRLTFDIGGGLVLKLPLHSDGEDANRDEYEQYQQDDMGIYAECVLVEFEGVDAILMEKVKPLSQSELLYNFGEDTPNWVWSIDSEQVGVNAKGQLVAYDYTSM